jgi:hypothetical protein
LFISTNNGTYDEPRNLVSDDQDTEQLFGKDVVELQPTEMVRRLRSDYCNPSRWLFTFFFVSISVCVFVFEVTLDTNDLGYPVENMSKIPSGDYCIQGKLS